MPMVRDICQSVQALVCSVVLLVGLLGCAQSGGAGDPALGPQAAPGEPISLIRTGSLPKPPPPPPNAVDEPLLRRVVAHYKMNRRLRASGPFAHAGADLNGNGRGEALVLLNGSDTCNKAGCRLVVFVRTDVGYRPVSTTYNVLPPILIAKTVTKGWRDLIVRVGLADGSTRAKRLSFSGTAYSKNAARAPSVPRRQALEGEMVIGPQKKGTDPATTRAPGPGQGVGAARPGFAGKPLR